MIDFAWSPDGAYLAYVSTPYGAGESGRDSDTATLWIVPVAGGACNRVMRRMLTGRFTGCLTSGRGSPPAHEGLKS